MRLKPHETRAIKETILNLDPEAKIYLFGSRVDDTLRGGDIDLLILSHNITQKDRRNIRVKLFEQIGEQKLDLIIAENDTQPFVKIALSQGILL